MRKFFTSLLLLAAGSGQLLFANPGSGALSANGGTSAHMAPLRPMVDFDVAITNFVGAQSGCNLGMVPFTVTVQNLGGVAIEDAFIALEVTDPSNSPLLIAYDQLATVAPNATATHTFTDMADLSMQGTYSIRAFIDGYPIDPVQANNELTIQITNAGAAISITGMPYTEDFEDGSSGWAAYANGTSTSSWDLGTPTNPALPAGNLNAWKTNLTGNYNSNEQSYVLSPCFDFTGENPTIQLDVWWSSVSSHGAKLQYTLNNGGTWVDMGVLNESPNWYNDNSIAGLSWAGGAQVGWAGNAGNASNGWRTATLENSGLANQPSVRFRIAFGANFGTPELGFAFDNFSVFSKIDDIKPLANVTPSSGCDMTNGMTVTLPIKNLGSTTISGAEAYFDFTDPLGGTIPGFGFPDPSSPVPDIPPGATVNYTFLTQPDFSLPGTYTIKFYVWYPLDYNLTNDTIVVTIVNAGPSITTFPYIETFETATGLTWGDYSNGTAADVLSTWELGTPATPALPGGPGVNENAWKTNLTGNYNPNEESYVLSPCFDFTNVDPVIEMDVWWNSTSSHGAKLQYTLDGGVTWTTIGTTNDPNWYNDASVNGLSWSTNGNFGWAGTGSNSSGTWRTAKHEWTGLYNEPNVRFRIAFGADGGAVNQGFAFDNFKITPKPDRDLVAVELMPFAQGCGLSATEPIQIRIYNNGVLPAVGYSATYTIEDNNSIVQTVTETVNDTIHPFTYYIYTFNQTADLSVGSSFDFTGSVNLTGDEDTGSDTISTGFLNSVQILDPVTNETYVTFENGPGDLGAFSTIVKPQSGIVVNANGAYAGSNFGMVMHGGTQNLGWSDFDALTKPFNPTTNTERFSSATLCVKTPDTLSSLQMSFYLNQQYHSGNFLWTNFRITVNGEPIPLTRYVGTNVIPFVPQGNQQAIRPDVSITGSGFTGWQKITADLSPYLDSSNANIQIAFESSVKFTHNYSGVNGTANHIDSIKFVGDYSPAPVNCDLTPYHPDCPCGPIQFTVLDCCPDPNNPLCDSTGSATESLNTTLIKVFPNPSQGEFSIDLTDVSSDNYTMEVMDVTGKTTRKEKISQNGQPVYTFSIADQPKGIYFLKVSSDTKVYTAKLVLQ